MEGKVISIGILEVSQKMGRSQHYQLLASL